MIRNAFQMPEHAYAAISIGLSVCLIFAIFVFYQKWRSRKSPNEHQPNTESISKD